MERDINVPSELLERIYNSFVSIGEIQENGLALLKEVSVSIGDFKAIIRTNESQHRGRPHCLIAMGESSAVFDIHTGALMAGTLKSWNRTAEKVVKENAALLLDVWNETRPDDQKLNPKK